MVDKMPLKNWTIMQWDSSFEKVKKYSDLNPILIHICIICLNNEYNIEYMHCLKFEQTNAQK